MTSYFGTYRAHARIIISLVLNREEVIRLVMGFRLAIACAFEAKCLQLAAVHLRT